MDKHEDLLRAINVSLGMFIEDYKYQLSQDSESAEKVKTALAETKEKLANIDFKPNLEVNVPDTSDKILEGFKQALQGLEDSFSKEIAKIDVKPTVNMPKVEQKAPVVNVDTSELLKSIESLPEELAKLQPDVPELDTEKVEELLERLNTNIVDVARNTAIQPEAPSNVGIKGKFNKTDFDRVEFGYGGEDVSLITLKSNGSTVRQFAFGYTAGRLTSIERI